MQCTKQKADTAQDKDYIRYKTKPNSTTNNHTLNSYIRTYKSNMMKELTDLILRIPMIHCSIKQNSIHKTEKGCTWLLIDDSREQLL